LPPLVAQAPAVIIGVRGLPLDTRIEHRRKLMQEPKGYTLIGRMHKIVFDPHGMNLPVLDYPVWGPNLLSWLDEPYPWLGLSKDEQDLLILGKLLHPSDLPHPTETVPTTLPGWASRGGRMPRPVPQRYSDRTTAFIGKNKNGAPDFENADTFYTIQPVEQILIHPVRSDIFNFIRPGVAPDGTLMSFLVNPKSAEAHFIGGTMTLDSRIHGPA